MTKLLVVFASAALLTAALGLSPAAARRARHPAPHHAHLVKHAHAVTARVVIPASALTPRKRVIHRRRRHR